MLKEELANLETKMEVLEDVQATLEQNIGAQQRDFLAEETTQVVALEATVGQMRRAPKNLLEELDKDQF